MTGRPSRLRRFAKRVALTVLALVILGVTASLVWFSIPYPATRAPLEAVADDAAIELRETPDALVLSPADAAPDVGLVFVPGARVSADAYAGKLSGLAESGVTVVIAKPILNFALADRRPVSTFLDEAPGVRTWYVSGHSVGGVRACQYALDGAARGAADGATGSDGSGGPAIAGLVLFGAYCADDLSSAGLRVLSIGAGEDGLSTPADIRGAARLLPPETDFVEIAGMNHAQFGDYGDQPGDNPSTRPDAEVRAELTELLVGFLG